MRLSVGIRGDETFTKVGDQLKRGNSYAKLAGALILVGTDEGPDEKTVPYAAVDAGAAIAQLTVEAFSRGLIAHPMAGFNADGVRTVFERDAQGRRRPPLEDVAFAETWGRPFRPSPME